ncbi:MAG: hypothetical protein M1826_007722 [Phylliscum demangeonii]|nr:MAG: hypothetical protein M1826_007722 [Phylliscum demangeonii]
MFMLRNVSKFLFGDASKESIIELAQGQLYLVRPLSPKGYSELIFKDAAASIRRTAQEFQYQLVVQRAYEEGEEELLADGDGENGGLDGSLVLDKDEKIFLLDEGLHFRSETRPEGDKVFAWRDLSGDWGDHFEFVCDRSVAVATQGTFELVAIQCQYERKFRKSHQTATESDLRQFSFSDQTIPSPAPARKALASSAASTPRQGRTVAPAAFTDDDGDEADAAAEMAPVESKSSKPSTPMASKPAGPSTSTSPAPKEAPTVAPPSAVHPEPLETLVQETAELHLFDFPSGTFVLQDPSVTATVSETGRWQYWLQITGRDQEWLGQAVIADINPVFNFEYLSFIFNHYTADGSAYSWLLRFKEQAMIERFQEGLMQALWEQLNELKWRKAKEEDRDYVLEAFQDLTLKDVAEEEGEDEEEGEGEDEEHDGGESEDVEDGDDDGQRSEHYDSDESADDVDTRPDDGNVNSQLAVGYKHDRSFVVRGSKIGVFKHTPNNNLEFSTNISKVQTPGGKLFSPTKVMLHAEDSNMILQNDADPHSLYRMDLEYGKVVDEWKIDDDIAVTTFAPSKKFAQMSAEPTFLGLSRNALYRIDPRLAGHKLVESELKQYASNNDFSAAATTEQGYIAVASNKGDIRMFDRVGINAKTHIPALGDPILGLDVSADGRWLLATCRTYLLLIDTLQKDGKHAGKLGFERSFARDAKPQPRRLGLQPAHVAQFQHETGAALAFTPARFNTGQDRRETSIVTATGPFIVTWNLAKVLAGRKDPYSIKRYAEEVKADNFKYGSDANVIVALPNEVNMVAKHTFRKPTRESISTPSRARTSTGGAPAVAGRRGSGWVGGGARLRRDDVVDSPY